MAETEQAEEQEVSAKKTLDGWGKKLRGAFDRGVTASKKGFRSAGSALSDFGDKSVLRIEKSQLKAKADKAYAQLGKLAYQKLTAQDGATIGTDDAEIVAVLKELTSLLTNIDKHTKAINAIGETAAAQEQPTDTEAESPSAEPQDAAVQPEPAAPDAAGSTATTPTPPAEPEEEDSAEEGQEESVGDIDDEAETPEILYTGRH